MFQDIDWNSDRSHVRKAILEDKARRTSLKEIGRTLDEFIIADKAANNVNILKSEEQGPPQTVTQNISGRDFYWTETLMRNYKAKRPIFLEKETDEELLKRHPLERQEYLNARAKAEEEAAPPPDVSTLT